MSWFDLCIYKGTIARGAECNETDKSAVWLHSVHKPKWCSKSFFYIVSGNVLRAGFPIAVMGRLHSLCIEVSEDSLKTYGSREVEKLIYESMSDVVKSKEITPRKCLKSLFSTLIGHYHKELADLDHSIEISINKIIEGECTLASLYRLYNKSIKLHRGVHGLLYGLQRLSRTYEELESLAADTLMLENIYSSTIDRITKAFNLYYTVTSEKTSNLITKLTIISAIFLPLTLIAGIYGMNFKYMPELYHPLSYPIVLIAMATIAVSELIYFKKKKWI
ncbi:magnesium transporter [Desulfurococcaceae archaeon MEX13E-LK6-19]|nr:magnesium transporter [Desulfurococcaceae archaeon MEX13E-LK6-19]